MDLLVVDESFGDPSPDLSLLTGDLLDNVLVLRSFGKFFGLAGMRLGFCLGAAARIDRVRSMAGPWAVSGPAIAIGRRALADTGWHDKTRARLRADAARLDALAHGVGWSLVGGTPLFRTYDVGDSSAWQDTLARRHIWTRKFPYSRTWLRLGLPGTDAQWARVEDALSTPR